MQDELFTDRDVVDFEPDTANKVHIQEMNMKLSEGCEGGKG